MELMKKMELVKRKKIREIVLKSRKQNKDFLRQTKTDGIHHPQTFFQ